MSRKTLSIEERRAMVFYALMQHENGLWDKSVNYIAEKWNAVKVHGCPEQMLHPLLLQRTFHHIKAWGRWDEKYENTMKEWGLLDAWN